MYVRKTIVTEGTGTELCDSSTSPNANASNSGGSEKSRWCCCGSLAADVHPLAYLELVYLVTALVPSDTACFANSPGSSRRTAVWISRLVMVERLL